MKPVTNILLVLALVCYVFLPFLDIQFQGSISGLEFTAGTISRTMSFTGISIALLPFISCFLAMAFNCLKNKYWSLISAMLIACGLWFYAVASKIHQFSLIHSPEVTPENGLGEGFAIDGVGIGYILSCVLMALSLISALISLLPWKFNDAIEKVVDDTIDKSLEGSRKHIKALGHEVRDEWNKIESKSKLHRHASNNKQANAPEVKQPEASTPPPIEEEIDKEDDSRFMPKQ
ncbi:MAG: hypothetical protein KBT09_04655 [Bacteroidales bacterium]|nr:hypothetical protein [Candidatus Sodaliphilus fimicaballi]